MSTKRNFSSRTSGAYCATKIRQIWTLWWSKQTQRQLLPIRHWQAIRRGHHCRWEQHLRKQGWTQTLALSQRWAWTQTSGHQPLPHLEGLRRPVGPRNRLRRVPLDLVQFPHHYYRHQKQEVTGTETAKPTQPSAAGFPSQTPSRPPTRQHQLRKSRILP